MSLFEHKHYWRVKTGLNTVVDRAGGAPRGGLIIEDCLCGCVRQIEFEPGKDPIIRIAKTPTEETP